MVGTGKKKKVKRSWKISLAAEFRNWPHVISNARDFLKQSGAAKVYFDATITRSLMAPPCPTSFTTNRISPSLPATNCTSTVVPQCPFVFTPTLASISRLPKSCSFLTVLYFTSSSSSSSSSCSSSCSSSSERSALRIATFSTLTPSETSQISSPKTFLPSERPTSNVTARRAGRGVSFNRTGIHVPPNPKSSPLKLVPGNNIPTVRPLTLTSLHRLPFSNAFSTSASLGPRENNNSACKAHPRDIISVGSPTPPPTTVPKLNGVFTKSLKPPSRHKCSSSPGRHVDPPT